MTDPAPTQRKHRLRIVARVILFLLLGAIVNVAVAWGCDMWSIPPYTMPVRQVVDEVDWWGRKVPPGFPNRADEYLSGHATGTQLLLMMALDPQRGAMSFTVARWRSGWPAKSLERSTWSNLNQSMRSHQDSMPLSFTGDVLPLHPLWPGFAINTLFYAAILWLLFAAPLALRRRRRIKRGLCPKCAYPVGTSDTCTECGVPVTPKAVPI